jgi:hypothetical protein
MPRSAVPRKAGRKGWIGTVAVGSFPATPSEGRPGSARRAPAAEEPWATEEGCVAQEPRGASRRRAAWLGAAPEHAARARVVPRRLPSRALERGSRLRGVDRADVEQSAHRPRRHRGRTSATRAGHVLAGIRREVRRLRHPAVRDVRLRPRRCGSPGREGRRARRPGPAPSRGGGGGRRRGGCQGRDPWCKKLARSF